MLLLLRLVFNCSPPAIFTEGLVNTFGTVCCLGGLGDILRRQKSLLVAIPEDGASVWHGHRRVAPDGSVTSKRQRPTGEGTCLGEENKVGRVVGLGLYLSFLSYLSYIKVKPSDHVSSALFLIRVFAYRYSTYLMITSSCLI